MESLAGFSLRAEVTSSAWSPDRQALGLAAYPLALCARPIPLPYVLAWPVIRLAYVLALDRLAARHSCRLSRLARLGAADNR